LTRTIEETYYDVLADFFTSTPKSVLRKEQDMTIVSTGVPNVHMNFVLGPRFTSKNMARRTDEALSYFRKKRLPMRFFLGPSSTPPELGDHLRKQGLIPGWASPGMVMDLKTVNRQTLPAGLEIHPVEDLKSFRICVETLGRGFEIQEENLEESCEIIMGFGIGPTRRWFLGMLDGKPVSTSMMVPHKGLAGIYAVATIPEARGKGVATAVTREALLAAKDMGYETAILEASKMGFPVYSRLGFKECCMFKIYIWTPK